MNIKQEYCVKVKGHYPAQYPVIFYKGLRITKEDFDKIKGA